MTILSANELSAASGALILFILLLIVTAAVFAIKFALDIALNKKLSQNEEPHFQQDTHSRNNKYYAVKTPVKRRQGSNRSGDTRYTIIPEDKLFILENPSGNKDKYR
ncbi:MAG: hypothetical protein PHE12_03610 [Clostridia bacterium]|nr:hypothetical protein [Clostridia bacterium]